jgi:hypothetical protein
MHHPMISIWRVSDTTFDSVADNRTTSKVRNINPEFITQVVLDQVVVEIAVRISNNTLDPAVEDLHESHSGLDKGKCTIDIDIQDLCHILTHIETYTSRNSGSSTSIADISTDAKGPDRYLKLVAQSHDGLYIRHVARSDDGRADKVLLWSDMVHL